MRHAFPFAPRPRRLRSLAVGAALLVAGLTGCGSDGSDSATAVDGPTTSAAPVEPVESDAGTEAGPAQAESSEPHVVTHAMGETEVPADPQRVVVLDSSLLDAALALDVTPIGAVEGLAGAGFPAYLGDRVADVELIGTATDPNLEQIATMAPDLIIGTKVRQEAVYEQLSGIAPTVFAESSGTNWTNQVRLTGEALNRAERAEELLGEFDERAAEVGEAIGADGRRAVILRFIPGQIRLYGPDTFSGSVLTAVGFDLTGPAYDPNYGMGEISLENLPTLDQDVVFATNPDEESDGKVASDRANVGALWDQLPAVQAGEQFDIVDSTWMTGIGILGGNEILDDLERFFG